MNLKKVCELIGGKLRLSKALKVVPSTITAWGKEIPKSRRKAVKSILKRRKRDLDKYYDDVMK